MSEPKLTFSDVTNVSGFIAASMLVWRLFILKKLKKRCPYIHKQTVAHLHTNCAFYLIEESLK